MENLADGASSWPWFHLMNDAIEGRLAGSAPLLEPVTEDDDLNPEPAPRHRPRLPPPQQPSSSTDFQEPCGTLGGLEQEWEVLERERGALERERELVDQDRAAVERERAAMQADRLWLDRERAAVEQERALLEQERAALGREREVLDQRALMMNSVGHSGHLSSLM